MTMKTVVLAAVAAIFAGCVETAGTRVTVDTQTGDASILECSTRLANRVKVVRVTYGDVDGIKRATVTLESLTHKRQELQARMVNDVTTFTGTAPSEKGVTARLQVRETDTAQGI